MVAGVGGRALKNFPAWDWLCEERGACRAAFADGHAFRGIGDQLLDPDDPEGALHGLMYTDRRSRGTRLWKPQMPTRILSGILILMASSAALGQVPGGCDTKVAERTGVSGCYLVASEQLGGTRSSAFLTTMGQVPQVIFSTAKVASEEER